MGLGRFGYHNRLVASSPSVDKSLGNNKIRPLRKSQLPTVLLKIQSLIINAKTENLKLRPYRRLLVFVRNTIRRRGEGLANTIVARVDRIES